MNGTVTVRALETGAPIEFMPAPMPACEGCGVTLAPDSACLEIGACERADAAAVRGAARSSSKYSAAPAAWTSSGRVD